MFVYRNVIRQDVPPGDGWIRGSDGSKRKTPGSGCNTPVPKYTPPDPIGIPPFSVMGLAFLVVFRSKQEVNETMGFGLTVMIWNGDQGPVPQPETG